MQTVSLTYYLHTNVMVLAASAFAAAYPSLPFDGSYVVARPGEKQ